MEENKAITNNNNLRKTIEVGLSLPSETSEEEAKIRDLAKPVKHVVDFSNM